MKIIEKDEFIKTMKRLIETDNVVKKVNSIFRNSKESELSDFTNASALMICQEDLVVKLLEKMFDTDCISYWLYDCDYGRRIKADSMRDKNGKNIDITTLDKLYDYIRYGKY